METLRTGVLLVNLGTPESPRTPDVRRYLREFLSDPYVIDLPAPARNALLYGVILPFRPRRSAAAYAKIWRDDGSPLLVHSRAFQEALAKQLGDDYVVELAMRYGTPSIRGALHRLGAADVARVLCLPLFPQYSLAATQSVIARVHSELERSHELPPVEMLPAFYANRRFIDAWAAVARPELERVAPEHVLLSYHGLPERQVKATDRSGGHCLASERCCDAIVDPNRDCYRAQCFATSRALATALDLEDGTWTTTFQSRLGPNRWIRPYTDIELDAMVERGVRRIAVLCPAFVADCLETLEEIAIRARERWIEKGGDELHLVPSLNASPTWVDGVARWIRERA